MSWGVLQRFLGPIDSDVEMDSVRCNTSDQSEGSGDIECGNHVRESELRSRSLCTLDGCCWTEKHSRITMFLGQTIDETERVSRILYT